MVDLYVADPTLNWENTLKRNRAPANPLGLGGNDLFASFCFRLCRDHGGPKYAARLWHAVGKRPVATTTQEAIDNFVVAASVAADKDLAPLFAHTWRWPVSDAAKCETAKLSSPKTTGTSRDGRTAQRETPTLAQPAAGLVGLAAPSGGASAVAAARGLVNRLLPGQGDAFVLESIPHADGLDVFELEAPATRSSSAARPAWPSPRD